MSNVTIGLGMAILFGVITFVLAARVPEKKDEEKKA